MNGIRIEVDVEALIRQNWKRLPWHVRARIWLLRSRKRVEAEAVRQMRDR